MENNSESERESGFWPATIRLMVVLLGAWALFAYGLGVALRPLLDRVEIAGAPLGGAIARYGAITGFAVIIAVFVVLTARRNARTPLDERDR